MTQPCRHRWGAWSAAWHEPGHGWWRKRTCHDCGDEEHGRDTAVPVGRDGEAVRTVPQPRPETAAQREDGDA